MFGLMNPPVQDAAYRSAYARCCQFQRRAAGVWTVPFLSYDAVFLYLCCADAGLVPASVIEPQGCCRLRPGRRLSASPDANIGRFCAAITVLLADIQFQDAARDDASVLARCGRFALRSAVRRAVAFVSGCNPAFPGLLAGWCADQAAVEANPSSADLTAFVGPTATALSTLAEMMPEASRRPGLSEVFRSIGRDMGVATVAVDCALDWHEDLKTGNANPAKDGHGATAAAELGLQHLRRIVDTCEYFFGATSWSAVASRGVLAEATRKLRHLTGTGSAPSSDADSEHSSWSAGGHCGALSGCNAIAERIGSRFGSPSGTRNEDSQPIACPRACQCAGQLAAAVPSLFGRQRDRSGG